MQRGVRDEEGVAGRWQRKVGDEKTGIDGRGMTRSDTTMQRLPPPSRQAVDKAQCRRSPPAATQSNCRRRWATPTSRQRSCALQCPSRRRQKRAAFSLPARDVKPDSPRFKDTPACSTTRRLQASSPSFPSRSDKFVDQTQALRNAFAASPNTPTRTWTRPPSTRTSVRSSNAPTSATGAPGAEEGKQPPHPR